MSRKFNIKMHNQHLQGHIDNFLFTLASSLLGMFKKLILMYNFLFRIADSLSTID